MLSKEERALNSSAKIFCLTLCYKLVTIEIRHVIGWLKELGAIYTVAKPVHRLIYLTLYYFS